MNKKYHKWNQRMNLDWLKEWTSMKNDLNVFKWNEIHIQNIEKQINMNNYIHWNDITKNKFYKESFVWIFNEIHSK